MWTVTHKSAEGIYMKGEDRQDKLDQSAEAFCRQWAGFVKVRKALKECRKYLESADSLCKLLCKLCKLCCGRKYLQKGGRHLQSAETMNRGATGIFYKSAQSLY